MKICFCIIDDGQYLDSYDAWMNIFLNKEFEFDFFIITTDYQRFLNSPLSKMLHTVGRFNIISTIISCVPLDSLYVNEHTQFLVATALLENIRECNQFDTGKKYDWYIQCGVKTSLFDYQFDLILNHLTRSNHPEHCAILKDGVIDFNQYQFIITNDRFLFSFIQNLKFFIRTLKNAPDENDLSQGFVHQAFLNQVVLNNVGLIQL